MEKYLTELVGTFFLVLVIGLTVTAGTPFAPVAIGVVLMVMVYMGGHVSGGHYNPAVSLGVWRSGNLKAREMLIYWIFQLAGAILAALVVRFLVAQTFAAAPGSGYGWAQALLAEALFTFALVLVVLNVAVSKATQGNSYYGLAIGFTILTGAIAAGGISGGAFNPAVGLGPGLVHWLAGPGGPGDLWLYLVGPLLGGFLAAEFFALQEA